MSTAPGQSVVPERVRQARLRAGLSLAETAARLAAAGHPLTRAALSKYELGKSAPRQSTMVLLARVLGVPTSYFLSQPSVEIEWLAFRKHVSLTKGKQEQVKAEVTDVVASQIFLEETLNPGSTHGFPSPIPVNSGPDVEHAAEKVRKHWKLHEAVVESVVQTIEDHGGVVVCSREATPDFDGLSGWANQKYPVIVSSNETTLDRRRYNFAHELGHIVLDCGSATEKGAESFAHRFAAAFLVPATVARRELGPSRRSISVDELSLLKIKFGLSMQAWARRALDLDIIAPAVFRNLCITFSRCGWRKHEPVEFVGNEEPLRLRLLTLRALAEGIITPTRAEELCAGCTTGLATRRRPRASELRRLSPEQQDLALREAAEALAEEYEANTSLRDFEAFGEHDLITES